MRMDHGPFRRQREPLDGGIQSAGSWHRVAAKMLLRATFQGPMKPFEGEMDRSQTIPLSHLSVSPLILLQRSVLDVSLGLGVCPWVLNCGGTLI